ncbi:hypothetical protein ONE63_006749 [Megalurothrips usitatus]|uniref:Uncharacterized protein n=1 Tax=Megalurothrips usitatus TaxID=439358 RepID=A0AAV7XWT4_9NEOP|nr:hypothetical protein ONE63_006749 [Megalurothrips usitatus]
MARLLSAAERPSEIRLRPGGAPPPPGGFSFGAEPPPPPAPLEVPEDRASVLRVDCRPPPPSGLPESFQMLLVREPQAVLRYNVTLPAGAAPVWELPWAPEPGASYSARLYTVSGKGRSEATVLEGGPLRGVDPVAGRQHGLSARTRAVRAGLPRPRRRPPCRSVHCSSRSHRLMPPGRAPGRLASQEGR